MSHEERSSLLREIEEIRTLIEKLQPEMYREEMISGCASEGSRSQLIELRKELAREMEQLHSS